MNTYKGILFYNRTGGAKYWTYGAWVYTYLLNWVWTNFFEEKIKDWMREREREQKPCQQAIK
jgi:hypothetical protein